MCVCGFLGLYVTFSQHLESMEMDKTSSTSNKVMKHKASSNSTWCFFTFQQSACSTSNRCRLYHQTGCWL